MTLIIKPTGACNFDCKFCSAHGMDIFHPADGKVPEPLRQLVKDLDPHMIVVTGGEPLMVNPDYYYELHDITKCRVSMTSNLKDFYDKPDKWALLFKEEWFGLATSFNYGDTRMWDSNTVYTEEMFIKVMDKWREYVSDVLPIFLAVIDWSNEDRVIDHVLLAKRLGTQAKLNNAIAVGKQGKTYPRYKMFQHYLKIIDMGLEQYESYCSRRDIDECPRNVNHFCSTAIRCCYMDNNGKMHVGICDEQLSLGHELPDDLIVPNSKNPTTEIVDMNDIIRPECTYCRLYSLCNSCSNNREAAKNDPIYCEEMKKLEKKIVDTGWLL